MDYYPGDLGYLLGPLSAMLVFVSIFFGLIGLALYILLLVFVARDATRRNMNIAGWIILALFTGFWGTIIYLLNRGPIIVPKTPVKEVSQESG